MTINNARLRALHTRLRALHEHIEEAAKELFKLSYSTDDWPIAPRTDTAFALGTMIGTMTKARGLLGRDIDDAEAKHDPAKGSGVDQ
jgi:hypothetical protein